MEKQYKIDVNDIRKLIETEIGGIASDMITVGGENVGYMYREEPEASYDSGWRFFSGKETQDYGDNAGNFSFYKLNTIANYDPGIIPFLHLPEGAMLARNAGTGEFEPASEDNDICLD